jgi:phosphohistidine swiveling domain-containing protein
MTSDATPTLAGRAAAPGRARGLVHLVRETALDRPVPDGAILVTRLLHPHQAPLLARVAGVITEEGSLLQHATTLAREFGIPAIVGVRGATTLLRDGERIEVDGARGLVTRLGDAASGGAT